MKRILTFTALIILFCSGCTKPETSKPNIILIMADDMGFSDIGCYGGEINTPYLDRLAQDGLRYKQFYNAARCCPTRASLLTGLAPHQTGMGWMTFRNLGHPGYEGDLNNNCVTIPEVLKPAGYNTYMSGKWHLTFDEKTGINGPKESWPLNKGFDRFFGTLSGSGSFYNPSTLVEGLEHINPQAGFFYTDAIVDHAIGFLKEHNDAKSESPFFLYVSFTAPHWPLHARDSTISRYIKMYEQGWDKIRTQRLSGMKKMSLIDENWEMTSRDTAAPAWEELSFDAQADMVKRMSVYAAQVEEMDYNIGRLIEELEAQDKLDNTVIFFLADNGGCAEFIANGKDKSTEALGTVVSFESYRLPWANASNTPFRFYKHWVHEGGISTPLIVHWPAGIHTEGEFRNDPASLPDIMATIVEISGASYPENFMGNNILPNEGLSLTPTFHGDTLEERPLFWEHEANRAIRRGKWKLVSAGKTEYPFTGPWELYDMEQDRTETSNLADEYPELVNEMISLWEEWANNHMVYPLDGRDWGTRADNPIFERD